MRKHTSSPRLPRRPTAELAGCPAGRRDLLAIASLLALPLVILWRAALLQSFLVQCDLTYQFEPAKSELHAALSAGHLPLWSPYILAGYPLTAEGQVASFYPLSLLVSWALPGPAAVNWFVILHLWLAAASMYLLARQLGLSRFSAWLSAFAFSCSGFVFARTQHLSLLSVTAWLPMVIFLTDRACRSPRLRNYLLVPLAWAMSALCGHPQGLFFTSLIVVFWIAWRGVGDREQPMSARLWRAAGLFALTFLLGAGLAAVQLLLTLQLFREAPHGQPGDLAFITSFPLLPKHLLGLIAPNWQGSVAFDNYRGEDYFWGYVLYIGLLPLALALIGATRRSNWPLLALALLGLALALAHHNPLYYLLRLLPGFSYFRAPTRYLMVFTFAAALLVGFGWQALSRQRWLSPPRRAAALGALVAVLSAFDLLSFDRTLISLAHPTFFATPNPVVEALGSDRTWWRATVVQPVTIDAGWVPPGGWFRNPDGWQEARQLIPLNVPESYRLRLIEGYQRFTDPEQASLLSAARDGIRTGNLALLSLLGVRYLVLPPEMAVPGLPARPAGAFLIHRNPAAFPRAFAVGDVVSVSSPQEALSHTVELSRAGDLRHTAVVQGRFALPLGAAPADLKLAVEEPRPERVIVRAQAPRDCLLVLNERHDNGWRLRLDGAPAPLLTVDTVLMGAALPSGRHTVEFLYQPAGLVIGRLVTLLSLVFWLALFSLSLLRSRRRDSPAPNNKRPSRVATRAPSHQR